MDQTIVDVSACPEAAVGDEVVLIGSQGEEYIGADELGALAGTNSYETLCRLAPRVPRRYVGLPRRSPRGGDSMSAGAYAWYTKLRRFSTPALSVPSVWT